MKWIVIISLLLCSSCTAMINLINKKKNPELESSTSTPISHGIWNDILTKHVNNNGRVDYKGIIQDKEKLDNYINLLETNHPNKKWSKNEQLAYWINAYNAFTVKLIVDNYPVKSIKDVTSGLSIINSVWDIKFITIEGQEYDLANIEHGILRKSFNEPRIHFAVNCASISCPPLLPEAYVAETVIEQMDRATKQFINDKKYNKINDDSAEISKIFQWYKGDFTQNGKSLQNYIAQYLDQEISKDLSISYADYNWNLNDI